MRNETLKNDDKTIGDADSRARTFKDGRHKKHALRRQQETAVELKRLALSTLTKDEAIEIEKLKFEKAIQGDLALDLTLWAYGNEIGSPRSVCFAGNRVHQLWLDLPGKTRKKLTAEVIWKSRARLSLC